MPTATPKQYSLDEYLAAAAQQDAMQRVDANANPDWREVAYRCVIAVAQRLDEFHTDAVLEELARYDVATHELRALGPVMMRAARDGVIASTGRVEKSAAVSRHHAEKKIWKSLLRVTA